MPATENPTAGAPAAPANPPAALAAPPKPGFTLGKPDLPVRNVSNGLSLWLPLKDKALMGPLLQDLQLARIQIDEGLAQLHYVHFSRFLPSPDWSALQVITEYDGEFESYVLDFVHVLAPQFDRILRDVAGAPATSCRDRPDLFIEFIRRCQVGIQGPFSVPVRVNSAYRDLTVIDVLDGTGGVPPKATDGPPETINLADVQANVLSGIKADLAIHLALRIDDIGGARSFLGELATGANGCPRVTTAAETPRPDVCVNVGLTYKALAWLGISTDDAQAFHRAFPAFVRGPDHPATADRTGDFGDSAPEHWRLGGPKAQVHIVVSLYGWDAGLLTTARTSLLARVVQYKLIQVREETAQWPKDANGHTVYREHFGFADGIGEPVIARTGCPVSKPPAQPLVPVGEALLGSRYTNTFRGMGSLMGLSPALAQNGTFAALRLMQQDVPTFERRIHTEGKRAGKNPEWIAAKMVGRWRNGTPLALNDGSDTLPTGATLDDFDYTRRDGDTTTGEDPEGEKCPIGAHMRRMNPRGSVVAGQPYSRHMLRRGMPYGPVYKPGEADPVGTDRGMVGLFLCSDLDRQFEFVLRQWAQGDSATRNIRGQQDPIIGAQAPVPESADQHRPIDGTFTIPLGDGKEHRTEPLERLVKTVGSAYLFMPGIGGLRHLASPASLPALQLHGGGTRPRLFDPADPAIYTDPFEHHQLFRTNAPVARLPALRTVWVFSDAGVAAVVANPEQFRRQRYGVRTPVGLLKMDGAGHAKARAVMGPLFAAATATLRTSASGLVNQQLQAARGQTQPIDWVQAVARPLAETVFSQWIGLTGAAVTELLAKAEQVLAAASPNDDTASDKANAEMGELVKAALAKPANLTPGGLVMMLSAKLVGSGQPPHEPANGFPLIEYVTQVTTLALAGFLPVFWGVSLVTWRLLEKVDGTTRLSQLHAEPAITTRAAVTELLRFDMPTPMSTRHVHEDGLLLGVPVRRGDKLMLSFASANRDAARFGADADSVNFHRPPGPDWSFGNPNLGANGDSFECLGRDLSEAVLGAVVDALRDPGQPAPVLTADPKWAAVPMFRAIAKLPITL